jgi:glycosyltransferase involved in cell wall biosynthesis
MLISIVVVSFNEARALARVKQHFDELALPPDTQVESILIDGGSRDGTPETARRLGFTKVVVLPGANIPVCRNRGLAEARGEWIAFVDADCLLDREWLLHAARLLAKYPALILGWPAEPPSPLTWVQEAWHIHWMNKNPALEEDAGEMLVKRDGFRMITTRNMIFHRAVADRIGGFDEALATGEDTDFVFRATMAGIPAWGLPALKAVHLGEPATLRQFFKQQLWHANRKAYRTIMAKSGMKTGGNAPLFTGVFLALAAIAMAGAAAAFARPAAALFTVPLPLFLLALSARTCARARRPGRIPALAVLYGAYGLARALDLVGLSPRKFSWKARR